MEECCVCLNEYDNNNFVIECGHKLCYECYKKIHLGNNLCPLCRGGIVVTHLKRIYNKTPKGKLKMYKYAKLKNFIIYRHQLPGCRSWSKIQKYIIIRSIYIDKHDVF